MESLQKHPRGAASLADSYAELRVMELGRDLPILQAWAQREHVREFWPDLGETPADTEHYLRDKQSRQYITQYMIRINGADAGYTELYEYNRDPVARFFPGRPGDRGWHIFIGEERFIGSGHALLAGRVILSKLFESPDCERALCEPDERNLRMLRFTEKLGHRVIGVVKLPDKTAQIMECSRESFARVFAVEEESQ